jgi:hypothetical protein
MSCPRFDWLVPILQLTDWSTDKVFRPFNNQLVWQVLSPFWLIGLYTDWLVYYHVSRPLLIDWSNLSYPLLDLLVLCLVSIPIDWFIYQVSCPCTNWLLLASLLLLWFLDGKSCVVSLYWLMYLSTKSLVLVLIDWCRQVSYVLSAWLWRGKNAKYPNSWTLPHSLTTMGSKGVQNWAKDRPPVFNWAHC